MVNPTTETLYLDLPPLEDLPSLDIDDITTKSVSGVNNAQKVNEIYRRNDWSDSSWWHGSE